jgi:putative spermidine/putrescine transport system permease protein
MIPGRLTRASQWIYGLLVAGFLVLPSLVVIPMAFSTSMFLEFPPPGYSTQYFTQFLADPEWTAALGRSLVVAFTSAAISVPVGVMTSWALVRRRRKYSNLVESVIMLPMMFPVVIFGFGLYLATLRWDFPSGLTAVILAHAVMSLPFVVLTITASLSTFDFGLVNAARVHGAAPLRAFSTVVAPLIAPAVGAGLLIALMTSLDEAVVATFLAGDTEPTLPVKMFASITYDLNPLVPVAATILTAFTVVLLVASAVLVRLTRRRNALAKTDNEEMVTHV